MSEKSKRQLKKKFLQNSSLAKGTLATKIFLSTLVLFLVVQVVINAVLSPMGIQLEAFNNEKTKLLEENRSLEQTLAGLKSIKALNHLSSEKFKLAQVDSKKLIYVTDSSLRAEK